MRRYTIVVALGALAVTGLACNDATEDGTVFQAALESRNEVPARSSGATGTAGFVVDGTTVRYSIEVGGITGIVGAHIHSGAAGVNGPIRIALFPRPGVNSGPATGSVSGILIEGRFTASDVVGISFDQLLSEMRAGTAYANVHTTAFPGGEIRGQVQQVE
jgi:hypothetical protein